MAPWKKAASSSTIGDGVIGQRASGGTVIDVAEALWFGVVSAVSAHVTGIIET